MTQPFLPQIASPALQSLRFTVYYGTIAHTPELGRLEVLYNTAVGVDKAGQIAFIQPETVDPVQAATSYDSSLSAENIDVVDISGSENQFFFPGFIDTHIHAPQFPNCGIFGNATLLDWLETYTFPLESSFKDLDIAADIYAKVVERTLANGTTAASYYATIHPLATNLLADMAMMKGQRALIGKCCMNQNSPQHYIETLEECQKSTNQVLEHIHRRDAKGLLIKPIITPRFAGSCTEDLLRWLGDLRSKNDYHCQTHLSENKAEIEWTMKLFPDFKNYTDIYEKTNLLGHKTILAHCVHLTDEERDVIASHGSGISHCPTSNSSITSGEARIRWLLESGVNVSLGTDCSGGFTPSILSVARQAHLVSRHLVMKTEVEAEKLSSNDVLYLATMGGAKALDMADSLGSFAVGKKWECQMIDLACEGSPVDTFKYQEPRWESSERAEAEHRFQDLIDKWLFNGDDRNVRRVYVNGRCVVKK
ncbi:unnamed protein product [Kuraishia capsulata CBS 1993]|uniref:Guanine deaminase n=1 Tax=Kuraishia capsulata CBS 1993 TaxID=1382522 RepID=W6MNC1_9ASCO|nr:uncharacterized protein KUCA_T00004092001 [Kuraishia capsulata CBS 1993]CDK28111.1 unnamed protein product [Kuraishia capsulata CBS 1993]